MNKYGKISMKNSKYYKLILKTYQKLKNKAQNYFIQLFTWVSKT